MNGIATFGHAARPVMAVAGFAVVDVVRSDPITPPIRRSQGGTMPRYIRTKTRRMISWTMDVELVRTPPPARRGARPAPAPAPPPPVPGSVSFYITGEVVRRHEAVPVGPAVWEIGAGGTSPILDPGPVGRDPKPEPVLPNFPAGIPILIRLGLAVIRTGSVDARIAVQAVHQDAVRADIALVVDGGGSFGAELTYRRGILMDPADLDVLINAY